MGEEIRKVVLLSDADDEIEFIITGISRTTYSETSSGSSAIIEQDFSDEDNVVRDVYSRIKKERIKKITSFKGPLNFSMDISSDSLVTYSIREIPLREASSGATSTKLVAVLEIYTPNRE